MGPIPVQNEKTPETMIDVATLILRSVSARERISELLLRNAPKVRQRLYVQFHPQPSPNELLSVLPIVYENAAKHCPQLDVRLLLGATKPQLTRFFDDDLDDSELAENGANPDDWKKKYDYVVLGGTFDRFHYGHKLLLSTAILLANKYIVCGVTDKEMNHKKTLWELIEPVENRIAFVHDFLSDISSGVELRAEPIVDPFGPSIVDPQLQCIVVSKETFRGGDAVNRKRNERGLSTLDIVEIALLDGSDDILAETKLSSSAVRRQLLGRYLRPPRIPEYDYAKEKYVVGLTGGTCSGKTRISSFLQEKGCAVIDCDKIGHEVMGDSEELRMKIGETFGADLIKGDVVNRKALGARVFKNKEHLKQLTGIMWPIMEKRLLQRIRASTSKIIIVDAAVLLEAGWDKFAHEVWTTMIPYGEAVLRVMQRDKLSEELAKDRINSQSSNFERVQKSNVVFCSLWEYEETNRQVQLAFDAIQDRLQLL